tara:strand:+ start:2185 stop:3285 length:1101 start_codon:yes stop_codon:yes gene_type:complete
VVNNVVFPIYSYKEIGLFLEIVHDCLKKNNTNFERISSTCSELDSLISKLLKAQESVEVKVNNKITIELKSDENISQQYELITVNPREDSIELEIDRLNNDNDFRRSLLFRQNHQQKGQYVKLLNESLRQKNDQIQKMYDSKSYLINFLAHELRNPLTAILNSIELMRAAPEMVETMELDNVLENVASDMKRLVDDVLDFAKLENNKMEFEISDVGASTFCNEFAAYGQTLAESKDLDWKTSGLEQLGKIKMRVDPFRLRQILSNLVGNALKFTDSGHIEFSAAIEENRVILGVHDTGKGIKKEFQSTIFEEFTQESSAVSREFGGSGLGLNICYNLCKNMKGELWFESEYGKGTTFYIGVPLVKK